MQKISHLLHQIELLDQLLLAKCTSERNNQIEQLLLEVVSIEGKVAAVEGVAKKNIRSHCSG